MCYVLYSARDNPGPREFTHVRERLTPVTEAIVQPPTVASSRHEEIVHTAFMQSVVRFQRAVFTFAVTHQFSC
jgi:hypothetical protein